MGLKSAILLTSLLASTATGMQAQAHQLSIRATAIRAELSKLIDLTEFGYGKRTIGIGGKGVLVGLAYRMPVGPIAVETDLTGRYYKTDNAVPTSSGKRRLDDITGDVSLRVYSPALLWGIRGFASGRVEGFVDPDFWIKNGTSYGLGGSDSWDWRFSAGIATDPARLVAIRVAYAQSTLRTESTRHGITGALGVHVLEERHGKRRTALAASVEGTYQAARSLFGHQNNSTLKGTWSIGLPRGLPAVEVYVERNFGTSYPAEPNGGKMHPQRTVAGVGLRQTFIFK